MTEQAPESYATVPSTSVVKRYASLRTIASILRVLGWAVAVIGVIVVIIVTASSKSGGGGALVLLFGGILYVGFLSLWLFACSAIIQLMIDMEENTRLTAQLVANR